ncbi:FCD domain-containing protein [Streptosporangium sp. NPDC001681]|uniref:FCD domain-containing protein n=1 Tax=Streptosporangium sp. NPDC001681 TaxID=3154395 RepID=UPI003318B613
MRLESEGLARQEQLRGYFATPVLTPQQIAELAGNKQLFQAFVGTNCLLHLFRRRYSMRLGTATIAEHQAIAAAIAAGDADLTTLSAASGRARAVWPAHPCDSRPPRLPPPLPSRTAKRP